MVAGRVGRIAEVLATFFTFAQKGCCFARLTVWMAFGEGSQAADRAIMNV